MAPGQCIIADEIRFALEAAVHRVEIARGKKLVIPGRPAWILTHITQVSPNVTLFPLSVSVSSGKCC